MRRLESRWPSGWDTTCAAPCLPLRGISGLRGGQWAVMQKTPGPITTPFCHQRHHMAGSREGRGSKHQGAPGPVQVGRQKARWSDACPIVAWELPGMGCYSGHSRAASYIDPRASSEEQAADRKTLKFAGLPTVPTPLSFNQWQSRPWVNTIGLHWISLVRLVIALLSPLVINMKPLFSSRGFPSASNDFNLVTFKGTFLLTEQDSSTSTHKN